ncbi:hypothetical protein ACFE04_028741 [Oxalis oulophora]
MEVNKEEAIRATQLAEIELRKNQYVQARKFALTAQRLYPALDNLPQLLAVCDVHCAAQTNLHGTEKNWYGILQIEKSADEAAIRKQYMKLALLLHPDKNRFFSAEAAFKLLGEAYGILIDRMQRLLYDLMCEVACKKQQEADASLSAGEQSKLSNEFSNASFQSSSQNDTPQSSDSRSSASGTKPQEERSRFWTSCRPCDIWYEYYIESMNRELTCTKCGKNFVAYDLCNGGMPPGYPHSGASVPDVKEVPKAEISQCDGEKTTPESSLDKSPLFRSGSNEESSWDFTKVSLTPKEKIVIDVDEECGDSDSAHKNEKEKESMSKTRKKRCRKTFDDSEKENNNDTIQGNPEKIESFRVTRLSRSKQLDSCKEHLTENGNARHSLKKSKVVKSSPADDEELIKASVGVTTRNKAAEKKSNVFSEKSSTRKKNRCETNKENESKAATSDQNYNLPTDLVLTSSDIYYPDPDFSDFDKERTDDCFSVNQVWAVYDPLDDMPRSYVLVKGKASSGLKLQISWLCPNPDVSDMQNWYETGLPVACGKYSDVAEYSETEDRLIFSQMVNFRKGRGGGRHNYFIYPGKRETWALFVNCNLKWKTKPGKHGPPYQYEFVEIISDFDPQMGINVSYLSKVDGFSSVFQQTGRQEVIQPSEIYKFSHRIPSYRIKGKRQKGVPAGSFEFDPASLPTFIFEVPVDVKTKKGKAEGAEALNLRRSPRFKTR